MFHQGTVDFIGSCDDTNMTSVLLLCRKMLKMCGDTEDRLAQELILFEQQIERDVIEPLFVLAEVRNALKCSWRSSSLLSF